MRGGCDSYDNSALDYDWMKNHDINLKNHQACGQVRVYYFVYYPQASSVYEAHIDRATGAKYKHRTGSVAVLFARRSETVTPNPFVFSAWPM